MDSSVNFIQIVFIWIGILTFFPGLLTNYAEKYLPSLFLQVFRYGRANVPKSGQRFEVLQKIEVPKKWFYHVYIYAIFLQSFIVYTVLTTYQSNGKESWLKSTLAFAGGNNRMQAVDATTTSLAVCLFLFQITRRLYETCCVCVYSNTKMNLIHYLLTWIHYTGCMLSLTAYSPVFSSSDPIADVKLNWKSLGIIQYLAVIIFFYGSLVQFRAHVGLASLRKGKENKVVSLNHKIPRGGDFETISCPNYWGEILVYSAIAILFKFQNLNWNFITLWVISNQVTTAVMNHNWYKATFPDYPKERKAVIPYLW